MRPKDKNPPEAVTWSLTRETLATRLRDSTVVCHPVKVMVQFIALKARSVDGSKAVEMKI